MKYFVIMCRYANAPSAVWWSAGRECYYDRNAALSVARDLADKNHGKTEYSVWEAVPPDGLIS